MSAPRRRVALVTGGGGGIGAAIALELGRRGDHVVTLDPMVSLDGTEALAPEPDTTAGRILAAGGSAETSSASVTDADAVGTLVERLVAHHGGIDAVVNVAGITRPSSYTRGTEDDWRSVLDVHLDGYRTVLAATLPHLVAGGGRVVGVTSGSGWRPADTGAYGCAKRAVASLTWELGRAVPDGVAVNALSPIAVTRMVTAALARAGTPAPGGGSGGARTGGLSLGSLPEPDELGPLGAHLAGADLGPLRGQVVFAGGSEAAVVAPPRLLEVVHAEGPGLAGRLDAVAPALVAAEAAQATTGAANPRFPGLLTAVDPSSGAGRVLVVAAGPLAAALVDALAERGAIAVVVAPEQVGPGFAGPADVLRGVDGHADGPVDAVVVAAGEPAAAAGPAWAATVDGHAGLADRLLGDAGWARALADRATLEDQPGRLVQLVDATTASGRSRAQALVQHARASVGATKGRVAGSVVAVEASGQAASAAALAALLAVTPVGAELSGAELALGAGWIGLRSHPCPVGSLVYGGADLPPWFDAALAELAGAVPASGGGPT